MSRASGCARDTAWAMSREYVELTEMAPRAPEAGSPRLLLVPSFTELEWGIKPTLEQWAEVATFDAPGIGDTKIPFKVDRENVGTELLSRWREATARVGLDAVDRRGWDRFVVVTDSWGAPTAVRIAGLRRDSVLGLAMGHAALSHSTEGERAPERTGVLAAMVQLARQGNDAFVRYGIAQMTRGGIDEDTAQKMVERFPDMELVTATLEALGEQPEPIGDELREIEAPLLLAKHEGCLGSTDEGFEDIVKAFPEAETVICPEMCASSPMFAEALRRFCARLASAEETAADKWRAPGGAARRHV
jgi:pimeloyl-ACP methyl ester carboxylesterase